MLPLLLWLLSHLPFGPTATFRTASLLFTRASCRFQSVSVLSVPDPGLSPGAQVGLFQAQQERSRHPVLRPQFYSCPLRSQALFEWLMSYCQLIGSLWSPVTPRSYSHEHCPRWLALQACTRAGLVFPGYRLSRQPH